MSDLSGEVRVHVDFNDLDVHGRLFTLPEDAGQPLELGLPVVLWDAEGNTARGQVVEVDDHGRAFIEMVAGTWRSGEITDPHALPLGFNEFQEVLARYVVERNEHEGLFTLSSVPSSVVARAATPSGIPQSQGAVLSSV